MVVFLLCSALPIVLHNRVCLMCVGKLCNIIVLFFVLHYLYMMFEFERRTLCVLHSGEHNCAGDLKVVLYVSSCKAV